MTFPLSTDFLFLCGDSFYDVVKQFCGDESVELLKFQLIDTSMSLLEVDDVFSILQFESERTATLKQTLGFPCKDKLGDYSFFVMPGIRLKLTKFIHTLRCLLTCADPLTTTKTLTISSDLIQRYPFLIDIVNCCESDLLSDFLVDFISNIVSNLTRTKNLFRYKNSVKDFATCLYILGGRNAYEFARINLLGSIPSLPSLRTGIVCEKNHYVEGEFYFNRLKVYMDCFKCTYAFIGEDCTGIIPRVHYDVSSNSFIGFTLPLTEGFPLTRHFSTNSLTELEFWHNKIDKASLLNVHVVQPLCPSNSKSAPSFILSAYGTNGKFTARDILQRWLKIFDSCFEHNIRILGFSTDCDPRSLNAMRNAMGFFSKSEIQLAEHPHQFNISLLKVNSEALQAYLQIIRLARLAFIEKRTSIIDRLFYSWTAVFIVRLWIAWLELTDYADLQRIISHVLPSNSMKSISKPALFITVPALFSLELNVHTLTYLIVLVAEKIITEEALNISLFNSQTCENVFRAARSMSGPFSTVVNFSIDEFLQRVGKLSALQTIKFSADSGTNGLVFPRHHKQSQQAHQLPPVNTTTTITEKLIEETVYSAYLQANRILSGCNLSILNPDGKIVSFEEVNRLAHQKLTRSQCKTYIKRNTQSDSDKQEEEDLEEYLSQKRTNGTDMMNDLDEVMSDDELDNEIFSNVSNSTFHGMRIFDSIYTHQNESFFPMEVNGEKKFMHKQTANWYFSKTKSTLSSDRSIRVQNK
ncbi:unnamed protein product [Adineta ricciae]|uniref:Uncharacterized protein n=1 Tax=Adineta ricciae TaxID=249248 RepID=A0A814AYX2_ADIRI|nr:unnamed protein product [Adineta ricciae]CAF1522974.1 unnamed protein product [Adineta ricciae]